MPFEVPKGWEWVKIKDIFEINPKNNLDDDEDVSFIPMTLISDGFSNEHNSEIRKWKDIKRGFTHFREGDVGLAKITPCFENRKSVLFCDLENKYGAGTTELHILRPIYESFLSRYALWFVKTEEFIRNGISNFTGAVGQQRVGKNIIEESLIPLPPLAEQHRIVAIIETAFAEIDKIEQDKVDLQQFIKQTKSKVLDLAIRGKLVPQNPNDEPASALLERIGNEQKSNKITSDKFPYEQLRITDVPNKWEKAVLEDVCVFERGITFPSSAKQTIFFDESIACIRTANVQETLDLSDLWYISKEFLKKNPNKLLKEKDIIISSANSRELVGKTSFVDRLEQEMTFGGFVMVIRSLIINQKFLFYFLRDCFNKGVFIENSTQTTNIANINTKSLSNINIDIPPLAEQQRIVQKIETIFETLDTLQDNL